MRVKCLSQQPASFNAIANQRPPVARVSVRRGGPRLILNDEEIFPLFAWSWGLIESASHFKKAGVQVLHPILGMNAAWPEPGTYDFRHFETVLAQMLEQHPDAWFLPRLQLDVPDWWRDAYPNDLLQTTISAPPADQRQWRDVIVNPEGGMLWGMNLREPCLASPRWLADQEAVLRAWLQHVEASPLRNRMLGYQVGSGIYAEWHYFLSEYLPDANPAMLAKTGAIPSAKERIQARHGLLRDPEQESNVIRFYRKFHETIADTALHFVKIIKAETQHRVIAGIFYGYLLENVWIQEAGHLSPRKILKDQDVDFLASPYSYQTTNNPDLPWWHHDLFDDAGNFLGCTRGVRGDGGYRVMLESIKRAGKLFFVELDSSTFLEPMPGSKDVEDTTGVADQMAMIGGAGVESVEGTARILQRDIGQVLVKGCGGWLFDFGPVMRTGQSWYRDNRIIEQVRKFMQLGAKRDQLSIGSASQIAAVYQAESLFVSQHWRAEAPFEMGGESYDYFTRWFLDGQARSLHRIGAPIDFLYHDDLTSADLSRYRLLMMVNTFYMEDNAVKTWRNRLRNSGVTVIWYYAPGYVNPSRLSLDQMESLTGFKYELLTVPGPMLLEANFTQSGKSYNIAFGTKRKRWPRFAVQGGADEILGHWQDINKPGIALKKQEGWTSIYCGAAPIPAAILRAFAEQAGAGLWSSEEDLIMATEDAVMCIAASSGERKICLHKPMQHFGTDACSQEFALTMEPGETAFFFPAGFDDQAG